METQRNVVHQCIVFVEYKVDATDLHLSGLEAFTFDYVVKWPVSLVISRKVCLIVLFCLHRLSHDRDRETDAGCVTVTDVVLCRYVTVTVCRH